MKRRIMLTIASLSLAFGSVFAMSPQFGDVVDASLYSFGSQKEYNMDDLVAFQWSDSDSKATVGRITYSRAVNAGPGYGIIYKFTGKKGGMNNIDTMLIPHVSIDRIAPIK